MMGYPTLQTLQELILRLPGSAFDGGFSKPYELRLSSASGEQQRRGRPTGIERMGPPTLQTLQ
jgi:hypothetical protein